MLLYGEDTFHINSKIRQSIEQYGVDEFNTTRYDLDETPITEAITDAMTVPFMTEKKVVVAENARFLGTEKVKTKVQHDEAALTRYLDAPMESTLFIITAPIDKLDKRKLLVKTLNTFTVVACELKAAKDLTVWARRQAGNAGMTFDHEALEVFIKRVAHSSEFAYHEMRKLLMYVRGAKRIGLEDVEAIITKNIEDNVYEITNALLEKNPRKALGVYHDLITHSEDPMRILSTIVFKYREILHVKSLLAKGLKQRDVAEHYNVSSGRAYYMVQNAKAVQLERLKSHLKHLESLDFNIKSGRLDKKLGLELFILST